MITGSSRGVISKENIDWRYERKFVASKLERQRVQHLLLTHKEHFSEIYPARTIHNIYFDTPHMNCYKESHEGVSERLKIRIRWYNDRPHKAQIEFKHKSNHMTGKEIFPLNGFDGRVKSLNGLLIPERVALVLGEMEAVLSNKYRRSYFLSLDGKFRVTVDDDIYFGLPEADSLISFFTGPIVELKHERASENPGKIMSCLPFRVTRFSKYVNGVDFLKQSYSLSCHEN